MKRQRSISPSKGSSNTNKKASTTPSSASRGGRSLSAPLPLAPPSLNRTNQNSTNRQEQQQLRHASYKEWKKQQSHDYNTHQFLDASATVHAGLFGARRLPEIKSLWRQLVQRKLHQHMNDSSPGMDTIVSSVTSNIDNTIEDQRQVRKQGKEGGGGGGSKAIRTRRPGESGGGKISSRHLRRRTNSHKPRRRYRFFPRKSTFTGGGVSGENENGVSKNLKDTGNEFGASEEDNSQGDESSAHGVTGRNPSKINKPPCRRARRKPCSLKASHCAWWEPKTHVQLIQSASLSHRDGQDKCSAHKWITTHLWHAKRFHMSPKLFNAWSIPLIHCNRGSRASLRLASSETSPKCTIQDGTWEMNGCAITIEVREVVGRTTPTHAGSLPSITTTVSSLMQVLVLLLQRLCGTEAPFLKDEDVLSGARAGEGVIHETDACPLLTIGPATFLFGCSTESNDLKVARVGILIHLATHERVVSLLDKMVTEYVNVDNAVTLSTMPFALLRIRGRASTTTVHNVLGQSELISLLNDYANTHNTLIDLGENPTFPNAAKRDSRAIPKATTSAQSWIKLKCHQPNQNFLHLSHNLASSGWDIYCHPFICLSLFQSFVVNGGACAIGLVEDARAQLEAYPPIPIFPRDYPDTEDGRLYWNGGAHTSSTRNEDECKNRAFAQWQDWVVIRTCIEGSWGRINTELKRTIRHFQENKKSKTGSSLIVHEGMETLPQLRTTQKLLCRETVCIHWESLTNVDNQAAVVVRGFFGIPFLQLLNGCGKPFPRPAVTKEKKSKRRPRRTIRSLDWAVSASPLSNEESELHSGLCQQLSASLSLPALLSCELYFDGKGTLNVGDLIYPMDRHDNTIFSEDAKPEDGTDGVSVNTNSSPLGVVTGGGFSPSRGKCHGIGFVGAARLINALKGTVHGMGLVIPQSHGRKKMTLKVMVVRDASASRVALLSILL